MSHNITMSGVKITDLSMLGNIVNDISGGIATMDLDATQFRTYAGQPTNCNGRINMPGPHDIALRKSSDGSHYTLYGDRFGMDLLFRNGGTDMSFVGKLTQEYALREAEYQAAQRGLSATRIPGANNTVTLELVEAS